jgi:hypothetical protein
LSNKVWNCGIIIVPWIGLSPHYVSIQSSSYE